MTKKDLVKPEPAEAEVFGITESDLSTTYAEVPVCLKCKECGVETHMTLKEYMDKIEKEGLMHCTVCPDKPELHFFKVNLKTVRAAGFTKGMDEEGISRDEMIARMRAINTGIGPSRVAKIDLMDEEEGLAKTVERAKRDLDDQEALYSYPEEPEGG